MTAGRMAMVLAAFLMVFLVAGGMSAQANDGFAWAGTADMFLGVKSLGKDDWSPANEHYEIGLLTDFHKMYWPAAIAVDLLYSTGEGSFEVFDFEATTMELDIGVRKRWDWLYRSCPYLGGGLALIQADGSAESGGVSYLDGNGSGVGFWLNAGLRWKLGDSYNVGLDLRYSSAEVKDVFSSVDAGGLHGGLIFGMAW